VRLILLNKPYGVLCQFTDTAGRITLARYVSVSGVYPAGRLDHDSEGLVLLTDDGALQARLAEPRHGVEKTYWAQVEGTPEASAIEQLRARHAAAGPVAGGGAGAAPVRPRPLTLPSLR